MSSLGDVFGEGGLTGADGVKRVCAVLDTVLHCFGSGFAEMEWLSLLNKPEEAGLKGQPPILGAGARRVPSVCAVGKWRLRGKEEKCDEGFD